MKIKINEKLICIPPYISTTWDQISFLHSDQSSDGEGLILTLFLSNGKVIQIPRLDSSLIDIAFAAHLRYLESIGASKPENQKSLTNPLQALLGLSPDQMSSIPIRFGMSNIPMNMEGVETAFQHNQAQANSPDLPQELIEKIATIAKVIANGDMAGFPKPEPHCNCMHCQVARAIHGSTPIAAEEEIAAEEVVTEEDLHFKTWDISQAGEKLYTVSNPLDPKEQYNVYLGSPVGCTCGDSHCEHIRAVLSS